MSTANQKHTVYAIGIGVIVLLLLGSALYTARYHKNQPQSDALVEQSASPTASGSASPAVVPVTTATPSAGVPTATATAPPTANTGVDALPTSAKSFLANFYAAYNEKDSSRLGQSFTADSNDDLRSLHASLFTKDGSAGGPTLFSSSIVMEHATSYEILGAAPQVPNWVVTVKEQRTLVDTGKAVPNVITLITLVPAPAGQGSWLIDAYIHTGSTGKYNGFFTQ